MCLCLDCVGVGGLGGQWIWEGVVVLCMHVCCESGFFVEMAGPGICVLC